MGYTTEEIIAMVQDNIQTGKYRVNERGEIILTGEYIPGSTGYGQDYGDYQGPVTKYMYYFTSPTVTTSPDSTIENMQKAISDLQKSVTSFDPFAGIRDGLASMNWAGLLVPAGLILAGGLIAVKAVRS